MSLKSMTGFADLGGTSGGLTWAWEARSVNGRGLDLRIRLADGFEPLEAPLRAAAGARFARGSITVGLRTTRGTSTGLPRVVPDALEAAVEAAAIAAEAASRRGLVLAPVSTGDLLAVRGVIETDAGSAAATPGVLEAMTAGIDPLLDRLATARSAEGRALAQAIAARVDAIADLTGRARVSAEARAGQSGELLRSRLEAVLAGTAAVDEARLAQELALLAVRADVSEELDRLEAHVAAARDLIADTGPVGRRFDFLMQEFNREANTLCSKAQSGDLTALGLEMKVVIDQLREQVQNVE